ncbi:MAG TPA: WbqC family protein [Flavobacteriales bacterium]|nr:WbqC family protein [Flavobacteriales bacterium]
MDAQPQVGSLSGSGPLTLGVMQPYFFPYLGYFQYIKACDVFMLYDDVQYIMRGWINRNNILLQGKAHLITVPLIKASPNHSIRETQVAVGSWEDKMLRTIEQAYRRTPHYQAVMPLITEVLKAGHMNAADLAQASISAVLAYLGLPPIAYTTTAVFGNAHLTRNERLLDLCRIAGIQRCVVPKGGSQLYPKEEFAAQGVDLHYLVAGLPPYAQFGVTDFVPSLSIIDVLMWNDPATVRTMLDAYTLE